jgi:hypothetical protein
MDGKGKATPSGARKWLVGFGFLAIRAHRAGGDNGTFFKEFNPPTAIRRIEARLACLSCFSMITMGRD